MIYFTSDLHFCHKNVLKYCTNRKFETVQDMHEGIINNWNKVVTDNDTVIVVGDVFFCPKRKSKQIMDRLRGKKILVMGNHDKGYTHMLSLGFDWVCYSMSLPIGGHVVDIKHYPFKWKPPWWKRVLKLAREPKYYERHVDDKGQYLIHGHTHSTIKFRDRQIHVGVDAWNMQLVPITKIESYIHKHSKGDLP